MKLLLITGVPGMGKTTIGNYLAEKYGFIHLDVELLDSWSVELKNLFLSNSWVKFVKRLKSYGKDIVMTWGFMPEVHDNIVKILQQFGFKLIWFDGNRKAAREAFLRRKTVDEHTLDIQMKRIENMNVQSFKPVIIDTFDGEGEFYNKDKIVELLFETK